MSTLTLTVEAIRKALSPPRLATYETAMSQHGRSDPQSTISALREQIYADLEQIRTLRNRIAHHEPIFKRNLLQDYLIIRQSIDRRCPFTAEWMERNQRVTAVLPLRPAP